MFGVVAALIEKQLGASAVQTLKANGSGGTDVGTWVREDAHKET